MTKVETQLVRFVFHTEISMSKTECFYVYITLTVPFFCVFLSFQWSLQSTTNPTAEVPQGNQNVWTCSTDRGQSKTTDPFEMLFGSNSHTSTTGSVQLDSGIISPQSQGHHDDLIDITNDELCRRLGDLLKKSSLEDEEKHCLQQVLNLVQQLDALTPRSGPNSLLANTSSEEASSMEGLVSLTQYVGDNPSVYS